MTAATVPNPTHLLGDVGGTHCRLALSDGHSLGPVTEVETAAHPSLESVVTSFIQQADVDPAKLSFLLSFGIKRHGADGWYALDYTYKYAAWRFRPDIVCATTGVRSMEVVHDFRAMGLALFSKHPVFLQLREGVPAATARLSLIVGAGSGVGHSYVDIGDRRVYDTHGAHMPAAAVNEEQLELMRLIKPLRGGERTLIFEDILGGVGLFRFYQACCQLLDAPATCESIKDLLPAAAAGERVVGYMMRVYAEWFGAYANTLTTAGHAHQGLYLCGGMFERMMAAKVFPMDAFLNGFHQNMVAIVDRDLRATPVYVPATEHTALYGLMELIEQKQE